MDDGSGLHVVEFGTRYEVHWDESDPREGAITHARKDWPIGVLGGSMLLVGGMGAAIGGAVGALFGAGIGALAASVLTWRRR